MKKRHACLISLLFFVFLVIPLLAEGQQSPASNFEFINPLQCNDFPCLMRTILQLLFYAGVVLVPIFAGIAALRISTSAGNPEKVRKGIHAIVYVAVGLGIIIFSQAAIYLITNILGWTS